MKIVKVGEYASCMPGDGSDPNLRVPVVTMQGDKVVDFLDPDEPILIGQSTVDLQADLLHRNLGQGRFGGELAKAQKIVGCDDAWPKIRCKRSACKSTVDCPIRIGSSGSKKSTTLSPA